MALRMSLAAAFLAINTVGAADVKTIVNNVPWWPESNLQFEEAVGVVSNGVLFATGMLEATPNAPHFNTSQLTLELLDLRDIVVAANTSLSSIVDCIANVPAGAAVIATNTLEKALGGVDNAPCITVLETKGEDPDDYPGFTYNSSISCFAAVKQKGEGKILHHQFKSSGVVIRVVDQGNEMMWLNAEAAGSDAAATSDFWREVDSALAHAGKASALGTSDIVDCTMFIPPSTTENVITTVQQAAANNTSSSGKFVAAQLTVVKVGVGGSKTKLRCTAIVNGRTKKRRHQMPGSGSTSVVVAGGFAYVSGVGSAQANATDGFAEIGRALAVAGSRLDLILNCMFFVSSQSVIDPFFHGFHDTFNRDGNNKTAVGFPPPSRNEFVGMSPQSQCISESAQHCPVLSKCVAAIPEHTYYLPTGYKCDVAEQVCKPDKSSKADKASCEQVCPP